MSEPTNIRRIDQRPLKEAISTRGRSFIPGLTKDEVIKWFFGGNAWMSIVVLGLIMLSLYDQSIGFNPAEGFFGQNYRNLLVYRQAGLEFVDLIKQETTGIDSFNQYLAAVRVEEFKRSLVRGQKQGKTEDQSLADANTALAPFDDYAGKVGGLDDGLDDIVSTLGDTATATKLAVKEVIEDKKAEKALYLRSGKKELAAAVTWQDVDLPAAVKPLKDAVPSIQAANVKLTTDLNALLTTPPPALDEAMKSRLGGIDRDIKAL